MDGSQQNAMIGGRTPGSLSGGGSIIPQREAVLATTVKQRRLRKVLPPPERRDWLLLVEAAVQLGCSGATVHRLRRGEIDGVPRLPAVQVGKRKWIVLKSSLERW
jgi:hypothetical protein